MESDDTLSEPLKPHQAVAAEVRAEMARKKVSQQEVARRLGVAQQTISRRITGEIPFDVAELAKIAEILGVPLSHFVLERAA
jgi:transcriptional regulator with XRE-family HTH domain